MKFRKKPVVIEAFQMTRERRQDNREWPEWLNRAWNMDWPLPGAVSCEDYPTSNGTDRLVISTLEGVHTVSFDDWIIRGVYGELYPCKPGIFAATYEQAEPAPAEPKPYTWSDVATHVADRLSMTDEVRYEIRMRDGHSFAGCVKPKNYGEWQRMAIADINRKAAA